MFDKLFEGEKPKRLFLMGLVMFIASIWFAYDNITAIQEGKLAHALTEFQQSCSQQGKAIACINPSPIGLPTNSLILGPNNTLNNQNGTSR